MYILLLNQVKWWCAVKYTKYFFASLASKFLFLCPFFFHGYFLATMPIDRWGEVNTCNFKYMKYYVCTSFTNLYMYTYYIVILGVDFTLSTYWKTLHLPLKLLHIDISLDIVTKPKILLSWSWYILNINSSDGDRF